MSDATFQESVVRKNLVLPERTVQRLMRLKEKTAAASETEVVRTALRLYDQLVEDVLDGCEVKTVHPDGREERVFRAYDVA